MPPWVAFPSLILLWADVVVSQIRVTGVVGQTVTLPCSYSPAREIAPMCWGRGPCPSSKCSNELVWTDGYRVTFEKDKRYRTLGIISRGDLTLTIQNAALSDTGTYCCRIEFKGWFNDYKGNIFLEIKPAPTTAPTPPKVFTSAPTTPGTTKNLKTAPPKVTSVPTPTMVFTSAPRTLAPTLNLKTAAPNVTMGPTSPMVSISASTKPAGGHQKFKTAPPKVTSVPIPPMVFTSAPRTLAPTLNLKTAAPNVTMGPTSPMVSISASTKPAGGHQKFKTAPPKVTSVPIPPMVFTSAPRTLAPTLNLKTAAPNVTMGPTSPMVSISASTKPAGGHRKFKTAPPKVTSVPIPPMVFTSAPRTLAPTLNLKTAAPNVTMGPTSPMVSISASTKPAGGHRKFKTETTSSSAVQTTDTPPLTPQETRTTSSLVNSSCPTDGNSTVTQPSDCSWQYNATNTILKPNTQRDTSKLYIGLSIAAMILLTILAAILTKKYLCGERKVLQISKERVTGTSQNETAVHYQAQENIYFENNLHNLH